MPVYPGAVWEPVPVSSHPTMNPTAVIFHSNAGNSGDLYNWWIGNPDGLQSHFQVTYDGTVYQYVDTNVVAYANVAANSYGISIETANSPDWNSIGFDSDLWSPAQVNALIKLSRWIETAHPNIPTVICTDGVNGYGWHEEFSYWTTPGHHCPGNARVDQFKNVIVPAVNAAVHPKPEVADMTPAQVAQLNDLEARVQKMDARTFYLRQYIDAIGAKLGVAKPK